MQRQRKGHILYGLNCATNQRYVAVLTLVPVNVNLFENRMFGDTIKM